MRLRRLRIRGWRLIAPLAAVLLIGGPVIGLQATSAAASSVTYNFQLDGDIAQSTYGNFSPTVPPAGTVDWSNFFTKCVPVNPSTTCTSPTGAVVNAGDILAQPLSGAGYVASFGSADYALPDPTVFTTGSKDTLPISQWECTQKNNVGDKVDLLNAYQVAWIDPSSQDLVVFFGAEKSSNLGDNNIAIWLLQDKSVSCNGSGGTTTFSGVHTNGDILLAAAFTNGGTTATIEVYTWGGCGSGAVGVQCSATSPGSLGSPVTSNQECLASPTTLPPTGGTEPVCAITNEAGVNPPWTSTTQAKTTATVPGTTTQGLGTEQFYEGGIDVTAVLNGLLPAGSPPVATPCFATTITDTRSSTSETATLFDFVQGALNTCATPTITTAINGGTPPGTTSAEVGQTVFDSATLTGALGTPQGSVTYHAYTNSDCTGPVAIFTDPNSPGVLATTSTVQLNSDGTVPNSEDVTLLTAGVTYYFQATYSGDIGVNGGRNEPASSACDAEQLAVTQAQPSIYTTPDPADGAATVGAPLNDSATLSGLVLPVASGQPGAGSITFSLYPPSDPSCQSSPVYTATVDNTTPDGTYYSTDAATTTGSNLTTAAGTWHWAAVYSGDTNNLGATSTCDAEPVGVNQATPGISTTPSTASLVVGSGGFSDTAVVGASPNPGYYPGAAVAPPTTGAGTVTFELYGPFALGTDASQFTCDSGNLLTTVSDVPPSTSGESTANYSSDSVGSSPSYTPTQAGLYEWVATYNGNANNATTSSLCTDASEMVTVEMASPTINTTPSTTSITIGNNNSFSDQATVEGGYNPGAQVAPPSSGAGTVTFALYGPFGPADTVTCDSTTQVYVSPSGVTATSSDATSATYDSASFTPLLVGTYYWIASYAGNRDNNPVAGTCNDTAEAVTVQPVSPGIASTILLSDTVKISTVLGAGGLGDAGNGNGTVTFTLTGPYAAGTTPDCTGTVISQQKDVPVANDGTATTPTAIAVAAGVYAWQVTYNPPSGSNYDTASTSCTDEVAAITYSGTSPIPSS